jgi:hypothetical protein
LGNATATVHNDFLLLDAHLEDGINTDCRLKLRADDTHQISTVDLLRHGLGEIDARTVKPFANTSLGSRLCEEGGNSHTNAQELKTLWTT